MPNNVSLSGSLPLSPPKNEEPPRSGLAARISFPFNATQTLAIVAIVVVVAMPGIVAAIPHASQASVQLYNATCAPLLLTPLTVAAYLRKGIVEGLANQAAVKADQLKLNDFRKYWGEPDFAKQSRLNEAKFNLLHQASKDYLQNVLDHPAARAVAFHQAKVALIQAYQLNKSAKVLESQIQDLRFKEAEACQEAAELVETPQEKLDWVARGLQELKFPLYPPQDLICHDIADWPKCNVAISLWSTAAEAFLRLPPGENDYLDIVRRVDTSAIFSGTQAAAAQCLRNGAYYAKILRHYKEAQALYDKSIQVMKNIDTNDYPLKMRIALQEEIVSISIASSNLAHIPENPTQPQELASRHARTFSEAIIVQEQYQQLISDSPTHMIPYYTIKRAWRLEDAAFSTPNLTQRVTLLREARNSVQKEWDQHHNDLLEIQSFTLNQRPFSLGQSLLGRLQDETEEAEQKLHQQNLKPLDQVLAAAWNKFRQWMKSP